VGRYLNTKKGNKTHPLPVTRRNTLPSGFPKPPSPRLSKKQKKMRTKGGSIESLPSHPPFHPPPLPPPFPPNSFQIPLCTIPSPPYSFRNNPPPPPPFPQHHIPTPPSPMYFYIAQPPTSTSSSLPHPLSLPPAKPTASLLQKTPTRTNLILTRPLYLEDQATVGGFNCRSTENRKNAGVFGGGGGGGGLVGGVFVKKFNFTWEFRRMFFKTCYPPPPFFSPASRSRVPTHQPHLPSQTHQHCQQESGSFYSVRADKSCLSGRKW